MGILSQKFKESIDKGKLGKETKFLPYYRTGIDIFDYINGVRHADGSYDIGLQGKRILMNVGGSGTGKTSMIIKMACSIAEQYEEADIWHYDYERSTTDERILAISGWDYDTYEEKYHLFQENISVESIYTACKEIEKIKIENKEAIQINTGKKDKDGNTIYELPPTILIVDSVALLAPADVEDDDELKGSMGATAIAKANTNVFKRIMSPIQNANIILMLVNHLTQKIDIGMTHTKAQINYLKQDESIPGGKSISYLTNTLIKLETGSKLEPDKELGVKGFYVSGIFIKSRNTEAGITFKMVFEQKIGINNLLTNFVNLKDVGRITGAGRSFKLDTYPDVKFSIKEFADRYYSNEGFRKAFDKAVEEEYIKFIPDEFNSNSNNTNEEAIETINKAKVATKSDKKKSKYTVISEGTDGDEEDPTVYKDENGKYFIKEDGQYVEVEYEEEEVYDDEED